MADSPSRRAIGTLKTAAVRSTKPKVRKPSSPCCIGNSMVEPGARLGILRGAPYHSPGTRLRLRASLTWIRWPERREREAGHDARVARIECGFADRACRVQRACLRSGQLRPPGGRLCKLSHAVR